MTEVVLTLPLPPSSNNLFLTAGKRRPRTPEYNAWIEAAGWALASQRPPKFEQKVSLTIEVREPPTARREDCVSREKAATDLLVRHGILKDDSQHYVRQVTMGWASDLTDQVRITIRPWTD